MEQVGEAGRWVVRLVGEVDGWVELVHLPAMPHPLALSKEVWQA